MPAACREVEGSMSHLTDVAFRFWDELISRPAGPLAFRFVLQPVMASLLAARDGYRDASMGRMPYLWTILHDPSHRVDRLREGLHAVTRVILLGVAMDLAYQFFVLKGFRPLELIVIVFALCVLPYLIVRGPAERISHRWLESHSMRAILPRG
jgi:hypothetical protein